MTTKISGHSFFFSFFFSWSDTVKLNSIEHSNLRGLLIHSMKVNVVIFSRLSCFRCRSRPGLPTPEDVSEIARLTALRTFGNGEDDGKRKKTSLTQRKVQLLYLLTKLKQWNNLRGINNLRSGVLFSEEV